MSHLANAHGVNVTPDDLRFWAASFSVAKAIDTLIDEYHVADISPYVQKVLAGTLIPGLDQVELQLFNDAREAYTLKQETALNLAMQHIGTFAVQRASCETVEEYLATILDESYLMSGILKLAVTPGASDRVHRVTFNSWLNQFGRAAYAWDTVSDVVRDSNEGNLNIPLETHTFRVLGGAAMHETRVLIGISPIGIYRPIIHRGVTKIFEKIQQHDFIQKQFIRQR